MYLYKYLHTYIYIYIIHTYNMLYSTIYPIWGSFFFRFYFRMRCTEQPSRRACAPALQVSANTHGTLQNARRRRAAKSGPSNPLEESSRTGI